MEGSEKKNFLAPPLQAIIPDARPSVHVKIKIAVTVRRGISKRSLEKIGNCEQSKKLFPTIQYKSM